MSKPELSLVIPCYNEEKNIKTVADGLVDELDRNGIDYELILVDNGSRDGTNREISDLAGANRRVKLRTIRDNQGYGFGVTSGLDSANGRFIGWTCADNQVSPSDTVRIFREMKAKGLDICKARRITRGDGTARKIASWGYNTLIRLMFFVNVPDVNGFPKMMKAERYRELGVRSKDWFVDTEILIKSVKKGYRIGDVPVVFNPRTEGKSKVNLSTVLDFSKDILKYRISGG